MEGVVRFCLAEQAPFTLNIFTSSSFESMGAGITSATSSEITITNIKPVDSQEGSVHLQLCNEVVSAFKNRTLYLILELNRQRKTKINPHADPDKNVFLRTNQTKCEIFLHNPKHKSGEENASKMKDFFTLEAELFDFYHHQYKNGRQLVINHVEDARIRTQDMCITTSESSKTRFVDASYNSTIENLLTTGLTTMSGKMNLFLNAKISSSLFSMPGAHESNKMVICKRILDEELATDVVLIPSNGIEVKCHRSFLVAHSDVFQTMFTTDMEEAKTRRVEIPDMSEQGVRAFLAYLYYWDESQAHKCCAVAVELLKAGHKYNVISLEHVMRNLLLSKPESWYDVDLAAKLFLFVRNFHAEWEPLKKKAVTVLKKKISDLKNSPTMKELFKDSPEAAMEFCQYAITL